MIRLLGNVGSRWVMVMSSSGKNRFVRYGNAAFTVEELRPVFEVARLRARQSRHSTVGADAYRSVEAPWWLLLLVAGTGIYTAMLAVLRILV